MFRHFSAASVAAIAISVLFVFTAISKALDVGLPIETEPASSLGGWSGPGNGISVEQSTPLSQLNPVAPTSAAGVTGVLCTQTDVPSDPFPIPEWGGSGFMTGNAYPLNCDLSGFHLNDSTWVHIDRVVRPQAFSTSIYAYYTAEPNLTGIQRGVDWAPYGNSSGGGLIQRGGCVVKATPASNFYYFDNSGGEINILFEQAGVCPASSLLVDDPSVQVTMITPEQWKIKVEAQHSSFESKLFDLRYGKLRALIKVGPLRKEFKIRTKAAVMGVRG